MSIDQGLWSARLPNGEVRSGTLEQLNEACRSGHLSDSTLVRDSRSEQWVKLADVLAAAAAPRASVPAPRASVPAPRVSVPAPAVAPQPSPPFSGDAGLWQVRLAGGELRSGTRQQLAEAFGAGHLDEDMPVLPAGASEWLPLGAVMDRSEPSPSKVAPTVSPPPPVEPPQASSPPPATASVRPQGPDEIWQVRLADGQTRSGTRQQLEEAFRAGHLDEGALVLAAGASEWVTLGSLARGLSSPPADAAVAEPELAPVVAPLAAPGVAPEEATASASEQVHAPPAEDAPPAAQVDEEQPAASQAAAGSDPLWQVKLTGKQLEEAFRAGLLGADTLVLAAGSDAWVPFGDVRQAQSAPEASSVSNGVGAELSPAGAQLHE